MASRLLGIAKKLHMFKKFKTIFFFFFNFNCGLKKKKRHMAEWITTFGVYITKFYLSIH